MFVERLGRVPGTLASFQPGPPATDRGAWLGLLEEVRTTLLAAGEDALETAFPNLAAADYLDYGRTGNRVAFEAKYFARRRLLNALVLAECVEYQGRFLDRIIDGVIALCEESGWQLPAHNSQVRNGPRQPLPDVDQPVIDLFAAETGAQLAVVAALLSHELNAIAPQIVHRIDHELARRIIAPYLARHFWWMGNGDEPMNNWTAWCTQNVLLSAFCRPIDPDTGARIVRQAAVSLDAFLKDYGEDGACEEGVLYYRHAGLCLFNAMAILDTVAPGGFSVLWREPKIRNISEYAAKVHVAGDWYFNFADCPAQAGPCGAREFLFGRAVGSPQLADFAALDWQRQRQIALPDEINLFYRVQHAFTVEALATPRAAIPQPDDTFLSSVGLFMARDDRFALAVKAGDNGDSHNHNDVGSIILYKDGQPLLIDVGVESYTAKTFSPRRYEIWTMQSAWHNLPTFGGVMQHDGEMFAAREVETRFAGDVASIGMEIAGAYPPEAGVNSYRRTVTLTKGHGVAITDVHNSRASAELSLMFAAEPRLEPGRIVFEGLAEIAVIGAGPPRVEAIVITDPRLRATWPERLYRVLLPLLGEELTLTIV
jgi:hypothetical protein